MGADSTNNLIGSSNTNDLLVIQDMPPPEGGADTSLVLGSEHQLSDGLVELAPEVASPTSKDIPHLTFTPNGQPDEKIVLVGIDWGYETGAIATKQSYGLNLKQGFNPYIVGKQVGDPVYRRQLATMKAGFFRYHHADQMKDAWTNVNGWVISPDNADYRWDRDKIALAMDTPFDGNPMLKINIANWPKFLAIEGDRPLSLPDVPEELLVSVGRLRPEMIDAYAEFCADLVRIINLEQKRGVVYWEVLNEMDQIYSSPEAMRQLAEIYVRAATAMKAVDPTIKVGGPSFTWPDRLNLVVPFIEVAYPHLDFVSYHSYTSGRLEDSNASIWDSANTLGSRTATIRWVLQKYGDRPIETFHNEFNLSYRPPDPRMHNIVGAVYDALALASITRSGATGALAWAEADGWYGKLSPFGEWERRPSSYVFQLYNDLLLGNVVAASSTDEQAVSVYATNAEAWDAFSLVNRSMQDQTIQLFFQGWEFPYNPDLPVRVYQISESGLSWGTVSFGAISSQPFTLPVNTITVFEVS